MPAWLDTIDSPADLKRLPRSALPQLATEMRQRILDVVASNGGHLAYRLACEASVLEERFGQL